ncbi:MAG: hypothetical protein ACI81L_002874 [Verrucomicrobiales bacterium]
MHELWHPFQKEHLQDLQRCRHQLQGQWVLQERPQPWWIIVFERIEVRVVLERLVLERVLLERLEIRVEVRFQVGFEVEIRVHLEER